MSCLKKKNIYVLLFEIQGAVIHRDPSNLNVRRGIKRAAEIKVNASTVCRVRWLRTPLTLQAIASQSVSQ